MTAMTVTETGFSGAAEGAGLRRPAGLQLSRQRGFSLHQASHLLNELEVRRVDRTTGFGNPFRHVSAERFATVTRPEENAAEAIAAELVALYRKWLAEDPVGKDVAAQARVVLRGHNLACWCALGKPCHRDVLLEVANA